jgi:hypothetical protein
MVGTMESNGLPIYIILIQAHSNGYLTGHGKALELPELDLGVYLLVTSSFPLMEVVAALETLLITIAALEAVLVVVVAEVVEIATVANGYSLL